MGSRSEHALHAWHAHGPQWCTCAHEHLASMPVMYCNRAAASCINLPASGWTPRLRPPAWTAFFAPGCSPSIRGNVPSFGLAR
eukprot:365252-Chlamydomonas_euryale.AAC.27